jgi:hypothetical protein
MLFEELEERIVLDASVDNTVSGSDSFAHTQHDCVSCLHSSGASPLAEVTTPLQQRVTDVGENSLFGRLYTDRESFFGCLHTDAELRDKIGAILGEDDHAREVDIVSKLPGDHTVYMLFNADNFGPNKLYSASDFPDWTQELTKNPEGLLFSHNLPGNGTPLVVHFDRTVGPVKDPNAGPVIGVNFSLDEQPSAAGCGAGQAELALHAHWPFNDSWHDTYDISLVNGFNYPIRIDTPYPDKTDDYTPDHPIRSLHTIQATAKLGNSTNPGVFGLGNDQCCASCKPPPDCCGDSATFASEAHPTLNNGPHTCSGGKDYAPCSQINPAPPRGAQCVPRPFCQFDGLHAEAITGEKTFTITFGV